MKTQTRHLPLAAAVACASLLLSLAGCRKEVFQMNMRARMEQPKADSATAKNYLVHEEEWIYWEEGDNIAIYGQGGLQGGGVYDLVDGANTRYAHFEGEIEATGERHYAVYPASIIVDNTTNSASDNSSPNNRRINYPATMEYRQDASAIHPDSSFGRGCFPMVATFWEKDVRGSYQQDAIDFHSVSGVVRVQLYATGGDATLNQIMFTSVATTDGFAPTARPISGQALVEDMETNTPYLRMEGTDEASKSITITNINQPIGPSKALTFYLPLPALNGATGSPDERDAQYALKMEVNSNQGTFSRTMKVYLRRNSITKMPAIGISDWKEGGTSFVGLVGEGSPQRPFQIYDINDLRLVRDAFNMATPTINGKAIDANTHFRVSRSDIVLEDKDETLYPETGWKSGIKNFKGILRGGSNSGGSGATPDQGYGITNNSLAPLFESIGPQGRVEYVSVKGFMAGSLPVVDGKQQNFAPLCKTNRGVIKGCVNICTMRLSTANAAGVCGYNEGTIEGCHNRADSIHVTAAGDTSRVAGICVLNKGVVRGCILSQSARLAAKRAGGIVFENQGAIVDGVCTLNGDSQNETVDGGMVCYFNRKGAVVKGCYSAGTFRTQGNFSGVTYYNQGVVDGCRADLQIYGDKIAGICLYQLDEDAWTVNCAMPSNSSSLVGNEVSGLVGYLQSGHIVNCYSLAYVTASGYNGKGGAMCKVGPMPTLPSDSPVAATPGVAQAVNIFNLYSANVKLYGSITHSSALNHTSFLRRSLFSREDMRFVYPLDYNNATATVSAEDQYDMGLDSATNPLAVYLNGWRDDPTWEQIVSYNPTDSSYVSVGGSFSNTYGTSGAITITPTAGSAFTTTFAYYAWQNTTGARFPSLVHPNMSGSKYSAEQQRALAAARRHMARARARAAIPPQRR